MLLATVVPMKDLLLLVEASVIPFEYFTAVFNPVCIVLCWQAVVTLLLLTVTQGPVAQIMFSANQWLRGIGTYKFLWYS